jgi:hypothetical protein
MVVFASCSPQSAEPQKSTTRPDKQPQDWTSALARQNNCALLAEQVSKSVGSNSVYSIDVQRVLKTNTRVTTTCYLIDLVQLGERAQAVFQIDDLEPSAWSGTCVVRLDCPTNFISILASEQIFCLWAVAFETTSSHHDLRFSKGSTDDDFVTPWSVLTIEGKLLGLHKAF